MKSILYILLFFLFIQPAFITLNAQEETVPNFLFLFGQIGVSSQTTITHTLTAQGAYWQFSSSSYHPLSTNSEWEEAEVSITGSTTNEPSYSGSTAWKGYCFGWEQAPYEYTDFIAYGFYKVTNSYNNDYFYIDLRDCKYAGGSSPCTHYNPDFFIRFNDDTDIFQWRGPVIYPNPPQWNTISTGEILNVWDIRNNGTPPTTSTFEDYWENALVATNNGNNHPRLVWGPYPEEIGITGYRIYRKYGASAWSVLVNNTGLVYEYTDDTVEITPPGGQAGTDVYYYVKGLYVETPPNLTETGPTDTVSVNVVGKQIEKQSGTSINSNIIAYSLNQNYPNPFNPSTRITYSVAKNGQVSLKIFVMLQGKRYY